MRIPPISTPTVRRTAPAASRDRPGFAPADSAAPTATHAPAAPMASVATLVALAVIDDARERRRRDAEQAEAGLDALEALDEELSSGEASEERLREIAAWSANITPPEDPRIAEIMGEIDLRAQVELTKYDRARKLRD